MMKTAAKTTRGRTPRSKARETATAQPPTKLSILLGLLSRAEGASLAEMVDATGWQAHSIRGAMAGTLKKKGHAVLSEKIDGVRRYRLDGSA